MFALREWVSTPARLTGLGALFLVLLVPPGAAQRQKPSGAEVWGANCSRCHRARAVDAYDARQWESVVAHMTLVARLTPDEAQAVREFLVGGARGREARPGGTAAARTEPTPIMLASRGAMAYFPAASSCCTPAEGRAEGGEVFRSQCMVCHGERGKGNGPAAAALNPPPANLTDAARLAKFSDDSLFRVITNGRGGMPAFAAILEPDRVREVLAYVRTLKP
ncbi:MAG TPA: c-type cytochrome [Gemmatimonadales bacterium]|nr:c-type cytochrome [Gemmatimonadales bacterium]